MSSSGQLIITDRDSIDRVLRAFDYTCVAGRPLPPLAEISTIADVNHVFSKLERLEPFSMELTLGVGSRRWYASGSRLYVGRQDDSIGALDTLWQLEDSRADEILVRWLDPQSPASEELDEMLIRLRPLSTKALRAARGLSVFCYETAFDGTTRHAEMLKYRTLDNRSSDFEQSS